MSAYESALAADMAAFHQRENARRDLHQQHADEVSREVAEASQETDVIERAAAVLRDVNEREFNWRAVSRDGAFAAFARALHAAGLLATRPEREIVTTVEELDALPVGSIVRTGDEQVWQRTPGGWDCLSEDGTGGTYGHETVLYADLPVAVHVLFRRATSIESEAGDRDD